MPKFMTTILVDINENDLLDYHSITKSGLTNDSLKNVTFLLYKNRMMGNHMVTIQIPLDYYILFKGYGLIK